MVRRARRIDWISGAAFAVLAMLAHPIGFLWLVGTLSYTWIRAKLPGWWKLAVPLTTVCGFVFAYCYASHRPFLSAGLKRGPLYFCNRADQFGVFRDRCFFVAF